MILIKKGGLGLLFRMVITTISDLAFLIRYNDSQRYMRDCANVIQDGYMCYGLYNNLRLSQTIDKKRGECYSSKWLND